MCINVYVSARGSVCVCVPMAAHTLWRQLVVAITKFSTTHHNGTHKRRNREGAEGPCPPPRFQKGVQMGFGPCRFIDLRVALFMFCASWLALCSYISVRKLCVSCSPAASKGCTSLKFSDQGVLFGRGLSECWLSCVCVCGC